MLDKSHIAELERLKKTFSELEHTLGSSGSPQATGYQSLVKDYKRLEPLLTKYASYQSLCREIESLPKLIADPDTEMQIMATHDLARVTGEAEKLSREILSLLYPSEEEKHESVIIEIRAGAGGDEAALFAGDLYRMYTKFAESKGFKVDTINTSVTGLSGVKEVIFSVAGLGVNKYFKFESGVHRVQRVPKTEAHGRVHTSTITVAVLAEVEDVEVEVNATDLRIDTYRSSGAGGQHVNKTDSAVRITHMPTGFVVSCQNERSQLQNKEQCMRTLRAKLADMTRNKLISEQHELRRSQVGTGERSEKIRTYNFSQDRLTDHRYNVTLHNLPNILEGNMEELVLLLTQKEKEEVKKS